MRLSNLLSVLIVVGSTTNASAYRFKESDSGEPLRWGADRSLRIEVSMDGAPENVDRTVAAQSVRAAFAAWAGAMPEPMRILVEDVDSPPSPDAHDHRNIVRWIEEGWDDDYDPEALAVTLTTYDSETGQITDADILINAQRYRWVTGDPSLSQCQAAYDLQNVLTHEIGHLLGLAHEHENRDATMFPSSAFCEIKKRDLDPDDISGVNFLYGEVGFAPEGHTLPMAGLACATAGADVDPVSSIGAFGLLFLATFLSTIRRRKLAALTTAVAAALFAPTVMAATNHRLPLSHLKSTAGVVSRGTVVETRTSVVNGRVYTDVLIDVEDCLKGICGAELTVRQLGGEKEGVGLSVDGAPSFTMGDEVVVFLRGRRDGTFSVVGMAQGLFVVVRDGDGRIRELVRDVSGLSFENEAGMVVPGGKESYSFDGLRSVLRELPAK